MAPARPLRSLSYTRAGALAVLETLNPRDVINVIRVYNGNVFAHHGYGADALDKALDQIEADMSEPEASEPRVVIDERFFVPASLGEVRA